MRIDLLRNVIFPRTVEYFHPSAADIKPFGLEANHTCLHSFQFSPSTQLQGFILMLKLGNSLVFSRTCLLSEESLLEFWDLLA